MTMGSHAAKKQKMHKGLGKIKKQDSPLFFTRENLYFYVM